MVLPRLDCRLHHLVVREMRVACSHRTGQDGGKLNGVLGGVAGRLCVPKRNPIHIGRESVGVSCRLDTSRGMAGVSITVALYLYSNMCAFVKAYS